MSRKKMARSLLAFDGAFVGQRRRNEEDRPARTDGEKRGRHLAPRTHGEKSEVLGAGEQVVQRRRWLWLRHGMKRSLKRRAHRFAASASGRSAMMKRDVTVETANHADVADKRVGRGGHSSWLKAH